MTRENGPLGDSIGETIDRLQRRRSSLGIVPLRRQVGVSFEVVPTEERAATERLEAALGELLPLGPEFVSVTYGAGGAGREKTVDTLRAIGERGETPLAAHLTCVGASRGQIDDMLDRYEALGISHIVALRGDPPRDAVGRAPAGDYRYASDLVAAIKRRGGFAVSVAAYVERHPESNSLEQDIDALKAKQDAGADQAITQFFFDSERFLRFRDRAVAAGITIPLIPGILPVHSFAGLKRFAAGCGATIPDWMEELFQGLDEAPEIRAMVASTVATEMCAQLVEHGVQRFHFYTLNRSELTRAVCRMLGVRESASAGDGAAGLRRA